MGENVWKCLEYGKMDFTIVFPTPKTYINRKLAIQKWINEEKMDEILGFFYKKPQIYIFAGSLSWSWPNLAKWCFLWSTRWNWSFEVVLRCAPWKSPIVTTLVQSGKLRTFYFLTKNCLKFLGWFCPINFIVFKSHDLNHVIMWRA